MDYYLAVDIGASSGRHILGYIENGVLKLEEIYRFENGFEKQDGSLIWNIDYLEKQVKAGIRQCGLLGKIPVSVSIDTWGVDYVLTDQNGSPLKPVYSYRDSRTGAVIDEIEKSISFNDLYAKTGIQKQNFNTIYQLYCDKKSGKTDHAKQMLMIPDYLSYCLTGVCKNEYTNATTTSLVNANGKTWDTELLRLLGIPERLFLPLSCPGENVGDFSKEMQDFAGFNAKVILAPSHDTASAVAGCPLKEDSLYISSGTWSLIGTEITAPILSEASRNANFTNEGGLEYRFRYLKNYMGMWLFQNIRKELNKKYSYNEMMKMAESSSYIQYFDVNSKTLVAPEHMLSEIRKLLGDASLPLEDTLNCVYHSLAKSYRDAVREIEALSDKKLTNIFIVGGGSKDDYLNRLTSRYTEKRVFVGISEATATGNLITQVMANTGINLADARKLVFNSFNIKETGHESI